MATDIAPLTRQLTASEVARSILLPAWLASLTSSICEIKELEAATKKFLPTGITISKREREAAAAKRAEIARHLDAHGQAAARLEMVTKLLLAYSLGGIGELAGRSRAEAYAIALDDVPAWALAEAICKWHRGEAGDRNYSFAPAPAILREVCLTALAAVRRALIDIDDLLGAKPLSEYVPTRAKKPTEGLTYDEAQAPRGKMSAAAEPQKEAVD